MTDSVLQRFGESSPDGLRLATLASVAARIDRTILRHLRLDVMQEADATAEADLWFSRIVAVRSSDEIAIATEFLEPLRRAVVMSGDFPAARRIVRASHLGAAALLQLEEELIELALRDRPKIEIERKLGEALATIREHRDRATDISDWALSSLPRLPDRVRATAAAWSLAIAAEAHLGYAVALGTEVPADPLVLDPSTPMTTLRVARVSDAILLGTTNGALLPVPATTPRVVRIEIDGESTMVGVMPGTLCRVAAPADRTVVLGNLRGERWSAASALSDVANQFDESENGNWILVDGTSEFRLSPHHNDIARALGAALARNGFSLITLGRQGVSHVVARAFMNELEPRGFTSGIYRLLHIIATGTRPDFWERGRALFSSDGNNEVADAVNRADAIVTIGASPAQQALAANSAGLGIPMATVGDGASGPLVPLEPPLWDARGAMAYADGIVERLRGALAIPAPPRGALADLVHRAAVALDQRDLETYNRQLEHIEKRARRASLDVAALVRDARPSCRLVGYLAHVRVPGQTFIDALKSERACVMVFWEVRTLWYALESVLKLDVPVHGELERAIAAACVSIQSEIDRNALIDPGGQAREQLGQVLEHLRSGARARDLERIATQYEETRRTMQPGDERTAEMHRLVDRVRLRSGPSSSTREADVWFTSDRDGQRIIGLSLLLANPDPDGSANVVSAIRVPRTPFEQYIALSAAAAMYDVLDEARLAALRDAIEFARRPGGTIDQTDLSRWGLSGQILEGTRSRAAVRAADPASKVDIGIVTIREDEFRAVLAVFPDKLGTRKGAHRTYTVCHADAGGGERYRIAVLRLIEQGQGEAQAGARDLIEDLAPRLVLVVGIAGGRPSDDLRLGDVVVSTRIYDFTVEARKAGKAPTYDVTGGPIDRALAALVANLAAREDELGDWTADLPPQPSVSWSEKGQLYGPAAWQRDLREKLGHHYGPEARPRAPIHAAGPIASSARLVKDPDLPNVWLQGARSLLAIEMESGGVYRAARERCPVLAIRGISDIIGLRRADAWTKYACASAAAFTRAFLRTRPIELGAAATGAVETSHAASSTGQVQSRRDRQADSPPTQEKRMTREELLSRLSKLPSSQFEQVLYLARIPHEHLPAAAAAQVNRAVELMRYVEQQNQLDQLARIVEQVVTGDGPASSDP